MESRPEGCSDLDFALYEAHCKVRKNPKGFVKVLQNISKYFGDDGKLLEMPGLTPVMHHEGKSAYDEAIEFLK